MTTKEFQLDAEALLSQIINGHGFLHYGYWEDEHADEFTLARVGRAQQDYFDRLQRSLPPETASILDVGSGTGSNAAALLGLGYTVSCVCPSARLNAIARKKLPAGSVVHECEFEALDIQESFDTLLFAESFHYINTEKALRHMERYARRGVLIFDYFPRAQAPAPSWRIRHHEFIDLAQRILGQDFRIVEDVDLTMKIIPTFVVLDHLKNHFIHPFVRDALAGFDRKRPVAGFLIKRLLRKIIERTQRESRRADTFKESYEYRLIQIQRVTPLRPSSG